MAAAKMSVAELEKFLREEFPQAFSDGDITIESADGRDLPAAAALRRPHAASGRHGVGADADGDG